MSQPVPDVGEAEVLRVVRREFGPADIEKVLAVLDTYEETNPHRVRLAALKLAAGSIEELARLMEAAKVDYRDLLAYAEYPEYMKTVPPGADPADKKVQDVIARDRAQYQNWLNKE